MQNVHWPIMCRLAWRQPLKNTVHARWQKHVNSRWHELLLPGIQNSTGHEDISCTRTQWHCFSFVLAGQLWALFRDQARRTAWVSIICSVILKTKQEKIAFHDYEDTFPEDCVSVVCNVIGSTKLPKTEICSKTWGIFACSKLMEANVAICWAKDNIIRTNDGKMNWAVGYALGQSGAASHGRRPSCLARSGFISDCPSVVSVLLWAMSCQNINFGPKTTLAWLKSFATWSALFMTR